MDLSIDGMAFEEKYGIRLTVFKEYWEMEKDTFVEIFSRRRVSD
jgi:hypothetical protein